MRAIVLAAAFVGLAGWPELEAQQATGSLLRCAQAAMEKKAGKFVKVEVETAGSSTEAGQLPVGTSLLELEVRAADGSEWELTCDEKSGRIIEIEQEVADASDPRFQGKVKVPEETARKTALAAHPGEIVEVEYELEASGAATYEFDVKSKSGKGEVKVEVDATSGKVVERRDEHYQIGEELSAEAQ